MAEYIFKKMTEEKGVSNLFSVASSAVTTEEIGNDVYPPARKVLARHSVPCPRRAARRITEADVISYDKLLCMDDSNLEKLYRISPAAKGKAELLGAYGLDGKDIADPWYTGDFDLTYAELELTCTRLLEELLAE